MNYRPRIAILDDYQSVALRVADWTTVMDRADITVFNDHLSDETALAERLASFDALCLMRERTPLKGSLLARLPKLRFIASTGPVNAAIDKQATAERGIVVAHTSYSSTPTIELTWALILASQRHLIAEVNSLRLGGWQTSLGRELSGRTLGILGLGRIGGEVARIGRAFGMSVIAWSANLTEERAHEVGAVAVTHDQLFARSDVLTIHTLLSRRTRSLVGQKSIAAMKTDSWLVNTARGAIVDQNAIITALREGKIAGYAVDVFDEEPLPAGHPFRTLPSVLATPHIGYVASDLYGIFYQDAAQSLARWLEKHF